jgi:hypothetical protein
MATPAQGAFIGTPASNSASEPPHTLAGDDADGVGELLGVREQRDQRAARQGAVADLAPAGAALGLRFAGAEAREVVVEQEALLVFAHQLVHDLLVGRGAERHRRERLGLAAGEERGAVRARQHRRLDGDRADLVELAAVGPDLLVQDEPARLLVFDAAEHGGDVARLLGEGFRHLLLRLGGDLVDELLALGLLGDADGLLELPARELLDAADQVGVLFRRRDRDLGLADLLDQLDLKVAEAVDLLLRHGQRLEQKRLRQFVGAALHHKDGVLLAGDDEVQRADLPLLERRVDDETLLDAADAHGAGRAVERDVRDAQRDARADHGRDVRVVGAVVRQREGADLDFVPHVLREKRADGAVGEAADQDLPVALLALALEEAAGDAPRGVGALAVVHGQREEIAVQPRFLAHDGRRESDGVADADDDGAVGLRGHGAHFEADLFAADLYFGFFNSA